MPAEPPKALQQEWREQLHAAGMRVTSQREALLASVWRLRHATADSLVTDLADSDTSVNLSTVYRGLDALERIGLVRHAHLGSGGPTYHLAAASHHLHLQCNGCGRIISLDVSAAEPFADAVHQQTGFRADFSHAAIYGRCAECLVAAPADQHEDES
jgi:Fur family ferric uptake transcriptional regulator